MKSIMRNKKGVGGGQGGGWGPKQIYVCGKVKYMRAQSHICYLTALKSTRGPGGRI